MTDDELRHSLRKLRRAAEAPPPDQSRKSMLLRAFDAHHDTSAPQLTARSPGGWRLGSFAAAAAVLVAVVIAVGTFGRRDTPPPGDRSAAHGAAAARGVRTSSVGEFMAWPGAASLPPLESGELVRVDLPVSILPSLGVAPPAGHATAVKADVVIGQDGLARAVRFVGD